MSDKKLKKYQVRDVQGNIALIQCDYMFANDGTLVFRTGERGSSEIVATFGPGQWVSCVKAEG